MKSVCVNPVELKEKVERKRMRRRESEGWSRLLLCGVCMKGFLHLSAPQLLCAVIHFI